MKFTLKVVSDIMNRRPRLCFALLLITGILFMITWGKLKSSVTFHIDELWQYSFANGYGKLTNVVELSDFDKWHPASVFQDYITVQPGEEYEFARITEASSRDIHPPLSHYALHVISSLNPGKFSRWYGLGVNIFSYALTIGMLYYLALTVFGNRQKALIATGLWGFSLGAVNMVMYIRMYCLLTLFTVSVTAFTLKYMKTGGYVALFLAYLCFILGGLTDYIFWIFGFFLTLAFVIVRFRHHFLQAFTYAAVALAGFLSTCAIFPTTYQQFINSNSLSRRATNNFGVLDKLSQFFDLDFVLNRFLIYSSDQSFFLPPKLAYGIICLGLALVIVLPMIIAFFSAISALVIKTAPQPQTAKQVNETILGNFSTVIHDAIRAYASALKRFFSTLLQYPARYPLASCLLILVTLCTYTMAAIFPDFQIWTGRAFFFLYPFYALSLAYILYFLHEKFKVPALALTIITGLLLARELTLVRPPFLFRGGYEKLTKKVKDANVIFLLDSDESSHRLTSFSAAMQEAHNVYVTSIKDGTYRQHIEKAIATADKNHPVVIINTIGGPPENNVARSIIGEELQLTNDPQLINDLARQGKQLDVIRRGAQLFQWFNVYQLAPLVQPQPANADPSKATSLQPPMPAPV